MAALCGNVIACGKALAKGRAQTCRTGALPCARTAPNPLRRAGEPHQCGCQLGDLKACAPRSQCQLLTGGWGSRQARRIRVVSASETAESTPVQIAQSETWELDFCSRPMLDERGKKVWELLVCDSNRSFEYSQYFPNNKINSSELRTALSAVIAQYGTPRKVRFFRAQMQTIITRALDELEIDYAASRRCAALLDLLQERLEQVYSQHPRFQADLRPAPALGGGIVEPIPAYLRGQKWAFVLLDLEGLQDEISAVSRKDCRGEVFDITKLGLPDDVKIPGVAVFSERAGPIAAWTSGVEVSSIQADTSRAGLIMEMGVSKRFLYATWPRGSAAADEEAQQWQEAKAEAGGVHFLAIQEDPEDPSCTGFWLLRDWKDPLV